MKAKLIKEKDWYDLYRIDEDGKRVTFASTQDYKQKLSLKNCQAIERGYDLDELAEKHINHEPHTTYILQRKFDFVDGFQKALEILGKFSEEDMMKFGDWLWRAEYKNVGVYFNNTTKELFEIWKSLQQNEWEVEVEMEPVFDIEYSNNGYRTEKFNKTEYKPKLDTDGCLILKRV